MHIKIWYMIIISGCVEVNIAAKTPANRVAGYLQLDQLQHNIKNLITENQSQAASIQNKTNLVLKNGIIAADDLADNDPVASYAIYHDLNKLAKSTEESCNKIAKINEKFKNLQAYIQLQIKELANIRRKHLQFPC